MKAKERAVVTPTDHARAFFDSLNVGSGFRLMHEKRFVELLGVVRAEEREAIAGGLRKMRTGSSEEASARDAYASWIEEECYR